MGGKKEIYRDVQFFHAALQLSTMVSLKSVKTSTSHWIPVYALLHAAPNTEGWSTELRSEMLGGQRPNSAEIKQGVFDARIPLLHVCAQPACNAMVLPFLQKLHTVSTFLLTFCRKCTTILSAKKSLISELFLRSYCGLSLGSGFVETRGRNGLSKHIRNMTLSIIHTNDW